MLSIISSWHWALQFFFMLASLSVVYRVCYLFFHYTTIIIRGWPEDLYYDA